MGTQVVTEPLRAHIPLSGDKPKEAPHMSNTLRDATEHAVHTVHTLTDLVSDALHHIDLPHVDLTRVGHRRRSLSALPMVAISIAVALAVALAVRKARARASAGRSEDVAAVAPSTASPLTTAAA